MRSLLPAFPKPLLGRTVIEEDVARLSPTRYEHITPYGRYRFEVKA
jgi:hypothetical protein